VYFVLVTFKPSTGEVAIRVKLLRELAHFLDQAHKLAKYFFIDIEDDDLRKEWFAQTGTPEVFYDEVDEDDKELTTDTMKEVVAGLYTYARVARKVERKVAAGMARKSGRPEGTSVLPSRSIIKLADVYRRSTGRKPSRVEGPFARLVRAFLTAIGQGGKLSNKYVVEKIKEARAQSLKDPNSPFRS
jgi:hypothetical protein